MITLRQLHYLESLSRQLHFGKAAQECSVSQPALSVQIRMLEEQLGVQIFERMRNGLVATDTGMEIIRRARLVLDGVANINDFARGGGSMSGELRIGIIPTIAPYLLAQLLPLLKSAFPEMEPVIRESRTSQLIEELGNGDIDMILAALPTNEEGFSSMALFEDPFVLAMRANVRVPVTNREINEYIKNEHLLLLEEGHCLRDQALRHCDIAGIQYGTILGTSNLATLVQMVSNGLGITILPKMCLPLELRDNSIQVVEFNQPVPFRVVGINWRSTSPNSRHFKTIGNVIRATRKT